MKTNFKIGPWSNNLLWVAILVIATIIMSVNFCDPDFSLFLLTSFTGRKYGRSLKHRDKITRTLENLLKRETLKLPGLALRNKGRGLVNWLIQSTWPVRYGRKSTITICCAFAFKLHRLWKTNGARFVVLYLKTCQICLMQAVAGSPVGDSLDLGCRVKRTPGGLPIIIPSLMRRQIREGNNVVIRFWMTLFGLFRIIDFKGRLSTSTITDPPKMMESPWIYRWIRFVFSYFLPSLSVFGVNIAKGIRLSAPTPAYIGKSSPTSKWDWGVGPFHPEGLLPESKPSLVSTSLVSLWESSWRLKNNKELWDSLISYLTLPHVNGVNMKTVLETFGNIPYPATPDLKIMSMWFRTSFGKLQTFFKMTDNSLILDRMVGRLGIKVEPAGKLRVFAFVDAWTQWVLKPIHDWIFGILKRIPQDGTFNQVKPIELLFEIIKTNPKIRFSAYSLDLSAATDRLPIWLQQIILSHDSILGPDGAALWRQILVNRDYVLKIPKSVSKRINLMKLRYATGQPMGALSSWAMLALTHHAIVQYAAWRVAQRRKGGFVPFEWFKLYAVLGDDIIILSKAVASEYLYLMDLYGVKISMLKSLVSTSGSTTMEFAKRFFHECIDVSMMPYKVVMVARLDSSTIPEFAKKWALEFGSVVRTLGYGYKVLGSLSKPIFELNRRIAALLITLRLPTPLPDVYGRRDHTREEIEANKAQWIDWLSMRTINSFHSVSCRAWILVYLKLRSYTETKTFKDQAKLNHDLSVRPDWFVDYSPKQRVDTHLLYLFDYQFSESGKLIPVPTILRDALRKKIIRKDPLKVSLPLRLGQILLTFLKDRLIVSQRLDGSIEVNLSFLWFIHIPIVQHYLTWPVVWLALKLKAQGQQYHPSGVMGLGNPHDSGSFFLPASKLLEMVDSNSCSSEDFFEESDFYPSRNISYKDGEFTIYGRKHSPVGEKGAGEWFERTVWDSTSQTKPLTTNKLSERDITLLIKHGIFEIFDYMRMLDHSISKAPLALNLMWRENEKLMSDNVKVTYKNWVSWTSPIWKEQALLTSQRNADRRNTAIRREHAKTGLSLIPVTNVQPVSDNLSFKRIWTLPPNLVNAKIYYPSILSLSQHYVYLCEDELWLFLRTLRNIFLAIGGYISLMTVISTELRRKVSLGLRRPKIRVGSILVRLMSEMLAIVVSMSVVTILSYMFIPSSDISKLSDRDLYRPYVWGGPDCEVSLNLPTPDYTTLALVTIVMVVVMIYYHHYNFTNIATPSAGVPTFEEQQEQYISGLHQIIKDLTLQLVAAMSDENLVDRPSVELTAALDRISELERIGELNEYIVHHTRHLVTILRSMYQSADGSWQSVEIETHVSSLVDLMATLEAVL